MQKGKEIQEMQEMRAGFWNGMSLLRRFYGQFMEPVCSRHGLTRMELDVLLFLANNPRFDTARDIVEQRKLTKSHVSSAIAGLEQRGCLERSYHPGNRRTVHLRLRPEADEMVAEGQQAQQKFFDSIFRGVSEEELGELERAFMKVTANIREILKEEI